MGDPAITVGAPQTWEQDRGSDGVRIQALPPPSGVALGSHLTPLSLHLLICESRENLSL